MWVRRSLLALTALAALGGCDEAKKGFDEAYDKKFRESCVSSATAKGAPAGIAKQLCDCTMDKINQRLSMSEKATMPDEKVEPIMNECVKSVVKNNG